MIKKDRLSEIVDIALVCLTGFGLIWLAVPITTLRMSLETAALAALVYGVVFSLMLRSKRFSIFVGVLAALAAVGLILALLFEAKALDWLHKGHSSYLGWLSASFSGFIRHDARWEALSLFLGSSLIMFGSALISRISRETVVFISFFAAGAGLLITQRAMELPTQPLSVGIFAFCAISWFLRAAWPRSAPQKALPGRGKYMLMFAPFIVIGVLLGTLFYNNDQKTDRPMLRRVQDFIEQVRPKYAPAVSEFDYFSIREMGFDSAENELGGTPGLSGDVKLFIQADKPTYLAGRISYDYSNNRWITSEHEWFRNENRYEIYDFLGHELEVDPAYIDAMEMKFGQLALYDELEGELPQFPSTLRTQNIIFGSISTKTLFLPRHTMSVLLGRALTNHQDSKLVNIDSEQLLTGGQQDRDFIYRVQYMETNLSYNQRLELLRLSHAGLYRQAAENFERLEAENSGFSKELLELLADYSDWIHTEYTHLPEELPQRVSELAIEITGGMHNNYDKAQAIRDYLVDNYEYSLEVEPTPEGSDFADHFLFEQKKGYCSYFATSMALMGRAAGLPTRYVEGFRPGTRKLDDTYYFAAGYNAHAWVEVYFEGYGWVAFEPTPPFRFDFDFYFLSREAMAETYDDTYYDTPYFEITPEEQQEYDPGEQEIESLRFLNFFVGLAKALAALALAALAVVILLIIINTIRRRRRLRLDLQADQSMAYAIRTYRYMLKILAELDLPILPRETPIEYGQRVDSKQFREFEGSMTRAAEIYSAAVYGDKLPGSAEAEAMRHTMLELLELAKRRYGSARFFVYQSVMGRF